MIIYEFLKIIFINEFKNICQKNVKNGEDLNIIAVKDKKKKIRKKNISVNIIN